MRALLLFSLLLLVGVAPAAAQSGKSGRLHSLINDFRERIGCRALLWHEPAAEVARHRSRDMAGRGYFDHTTPDGRTFVDELREAGIESWGTVAENIALTQAGPEAALELWVESRPHRRNLEYCSFTHQAIGESAGYWTQILIAGPRKPRVK